MNALDTLFAKKKRQLLSVFFPACYPKPDSLLRTIRTMEAHGVDFLEIGIPFSDPLADGPVIQQANMKAIDNGFSIDLLFNQLESAIPVPGIPLLLMGYLNPVLKYGMEDFCRRASGVGVSGIILPDMPPREYLLHYSDLFKQYNLHNILMITPTTSEQRILETDRLSTSFIYVVSASSTTGNTGNSGPDSSTRSFLERVAAMNLRSPLITGFGVSGRERLELAWKYTNGAISGTAFINELNEANTEEEAIVRLLEKLIPNFKDPETCL